MSNLKKCLALLLLLPGLAQAAITYVGASGAANNTNGAAMSPGVDGSTASGDLVLCLVGQKNATNYTTITNSVGGYTRLIGVAGSSGSTLTYWAKISAGSESSPTFESTDTTAGRTIIGQCVTFRGTLNTVSGIVAHSATGSGAAAAAITTPALTVTTDNTLVVAGGIRANQWAAEDIGALSTMTEIGQPERTSSAQVALKWDRVIQTTAGNISSGTWTSTVNTAAYAAIVISIKPAASAPTWSVSPTVSAQDDNDYTLSYTPSVASTFYAVACKKDQTAPTIAQVKAGNCTGDVAAVASVNEAVTGADTTVLGGSLTYPIHDLYAVLSNAGGDSTLVTLADEMLDAPTGYQYDLLTSVSATSPCADLNLTISPTIAAADVIKTTTVTSPDNFSLTVGADCEHSYNDPDGLQQTSTIDVYDTTAGAWMTGGPTTIWWNNSPPVANPNSYDTADTLINGIPMTSWDVRSQVTDADGDTLTVTSSDTGVGTGVDKRAITITDGVHTGTPSCAVADTSGNYNLTITDPAGDSDSVYVTWTCYDQRSVPDVVDTALTSAASSIEALNLTYSFTSACSNTIAALNVISQDPAATTSVNPFTNVHMVVSTGTCATRAKNISLRFMP